MAWAEKLPRGKWRGVWRTPDGAKHNTNKGTHPEHPYPTKKLALDAAKAEEVGASRKASISSGKASASIKWGDYWDGNRRTRTDTESSAVENAIVSLYLRPKWGEEPLNCIKQRDVKAWLLDLEATGLGMAYVHRIYGVFRASINRAMDLEILDASPCANVKVPKAPRVKKPMKNQDNLTHLRPHLKQCYQNLLDFGEETGLRPGEMFGLHGEQADRKTGWLTVDRVYVSRLRVVRQSPKDDDQRDVPLTAKAIGVLDRALADRDLKTGCGIEHRYRGRAPKRCRSPLVFLNEVGDPITANAYWKALNRAADKAGVTGCKPYDSRHWFITRALEGGLDIVTVAEIVGHADVKQTQDYVFRTEALRDRVRAALGEREPLAVVPHEKPVDTLRQGAVQSGHDDGAMDHHTGS